MSDKFILKRERLDEEYEATIYAWPVHGPDVPVEIEVEIVAMNGDYYDHCYAETSTTPLRQWPPHATAVSTSTGSRRSSASLRLPSVTSWTFTD